MAVRIIDDWPLGSPSSARSVFSARTEFLAVRSRFSTHGFTRVTQTQWVTAFRLKHYLKQVVNWLNSFGHSLGFWTWIIAYASKLPIFASFSSYSLDLEPAEMEHPLMQICIKQTARVKGHLQSNTFQYCWNFLRWNRLWDDCSAFLTRQKHLKSAQNSD